MTKQREVEIKIRVLDTSLARRLVVDLGLIPVDRCIEVDHYFNHPCRDFGATDEAIRLRERKCKSGKTYYALTYKGPREDPRSPVKIRREIEVLLDEESWSKLHDLLLSLGFTRVISFAKERELYENDSLKASLDNLYGVGFFMELEASSSEHRGVLEDVIKRFVEPGVGEVVDKTYLEICVETGLCRKDTT